MSKLQDTAAVDSIRQFSTACQKVASLNAAAERAYLESPDTESPKYLSIMRRREDDIKTIRSLFDIVFLLFREHKQDASAVYEFMIRLSIIHNSNPDASIPTEAALQNLMLHMSKPGEPPPNVFTELDPFAVAAAMKVKDPKLTVRAAAKAVGFGTNYTKLQNNDLWKMAATGAKKRKVVSPKRGSAEVVTDSGGRRSVKIDAIDDREGDPSDNADRRIGRF